MPRKSTKAKKVSHSKKNSPKLFVIGIIALIVVVITLWQSQRPTSEVKSNLNDTKSTLQNTAIEINQNTPSSLNSVK